MIVGGVAAVALMVALSFVLAHFGLSDARLEPQMIADWLLTRGVKIIVIVVAALVVIRAATVGIAAVQQRVGSGDVERDLEWHRRASTLGGILTRLVTVSVWFIALMMLLRELAIDVVPILTGAGIAGLAVGFGAQNLVRDVISGFFLILEDQVRVGDAARINDVAGAIEQVNLRTIVLRDGEGAVHVFPNGTVTSLANLSKHFAYAIVDVRAAYGEHLERVFGTIREVGATMQADPQFKPLLLASIEITGVESIADGYSTIRAKFKTLPLNNGRVANELRRRLLTTLAARGVKPYAP
jgi:small conductance mechanosensitive channel